ncbi:MAG: SDR family NAD(P)-dependent oxidoreductase [Alphaproteobacteria bacterium]|nr:SDR family NAD(P)-dependent oxidoreductase [Alphaproteobacteria bacterium]
MGFWTDKRVFLSGGSKGIGREAALLLAKQGAKVAIAARGQAALDEVLAALNAISTGHSAHAIDIGDPAAVKAGVDAAAGVMGGLDVLICNAGYAATGSVLDVPESQFQELLDVNYLGNVWLVRAAAPHLIASKGHISLVSSMLGFMSVWGYGAYSASKFAVAGMAEALRQEMLLHDVTVTLFYPPTTDTPGLEKENEDKHPISWAIESENFLMKTYPPEAVAAEILRSIERGRFENIIGWDSWLALLGRRSLPSLFRAAVDSDLRKAAKKVAETPES